MAQTPASQTGSGGRMMARREQPMARREQPLARMRNDLGTLFGRLMGGWLAPFGQDFEPLRLWDLNMTENDNEIAIRAEVPGFEPNEMDVQLNRGVLTIKAEKEQKGDGREEYRSFVRSIALPDGIQTDKAQATYLNGVLEVHIPKAEGAQTRRIEVQAQQAPSAPAGATASPEGNGGQQTQKQAAAPAPEKATK